MNKGSIKARSPYLFIWVHIVKPTRASSSASFLASLPADLCHFLLWSIGKVAWVWMLGLLWTCRGAQIPLADEKNRAQKPSRQMGCLKTNLKLCLATKKVLTGGLVDFPTQSHGYGHFFDNEDAMQKKEYQYVSRKHSVHTLPNKG
jgi:hypothetical protein